MKKVYISVIYVFAFLFLINCNDLSVVYATNLREEAVNLAASQVGYHEKNSTDNLYDFTANSGSANYTKYAVTLGVTYGQPWNATFFWWVMDSVGVPREAYPTRTTVTSDWFIARNMFKETEEYIPQPGDYIILGDCEQCGIVESVDENSVTYIAGNVSDEVARVTRDLNDEYIYGYGLIDYDYVYQPIPLDMGESLCAILLRTDIWKSLRNYNDRPVLWTEVHRSDYRWLCKRQSDGTYIIQSLYDGKVIEVKDGETARHTEVVMAEPKEEDNTCQKWYICENGSGVRLIPQHATNFCLNVYEQARIDGTKMTIYQHNDSEAQMFTFYPIDYIGLTGINIVSDYSKTMYVGETQILDYSIVPENASSNMVSWVSSDNSVAEVDEDGIVKAKKEGMVTVLCKSTYDNTISDRILIQVKSNSTEQEGTTEQGTLTQEQETTTEKEEITTPMQEATTEKQESTTQKQEIVKNGTRIKARQCWFEITSAKKKTAKVVGVSNKKATSIKIPATVKYKDKTYKITSIEKNAFKNNKKIKSVTIGDNVKSVQEGAFLGCKQLKKVVIGKKVATIGKKAFYECKKLKTIKIKSTKLKKIGSKAFKKIDKSPVIYAPKNRINKYQNLFEGKI